MHCSSARSPAGVTAAQNNGRPANTAMLQGTRPAHLAGVREPRAEGHILRQAVRVPHLRARPRVSPAQSPLCCTLCMPLLLLCTSTARGKLRHQQRPWGTSAKCCVRMQASLRRGGRRPRGAARPARLVGRCADEEGAAAGDRHARHRAAVLRQVRDQHAARLPGRRRGRACRTPRAAWRVRSEGAHVSVAGPRRGCEEGAPRDTGSGERRCGAACEGPALAVILHASAGSGEPHGKATPIHRDRLLHLGGSGAGQAPSASERYGIGLWYARVRRTGGRVRGQVGVDGRVDGVADAERAAGARQVPQAAAAPRLARARRPHAPSRRPERCRRSGGCTR